jgi:hypothetical protein
MTIIAEFKASPEHTGSTALTFEVQQGLRKWEKTEAQCRARARRVHVDSGEVPLGALLLKVVVRVGLIIRGTIISQNCSLPTITASAEVFDPALVSQRL